MDRLARLHIVTNLYQRSTTCASLKPSSHTRARARTWAASLMSPGFDPNACTDVFTDNVSQSINGRDNYNAYRADAIQWTRLTTLFSERQRSALVGSLTAVPKVSARSFDLEEFCQPDGATGLIEHPDRAYAMNVANKRF